MTQQEARMVAEYLINFLTYMKDTIQLSIIRCLKQKYYYDEHRRDSRES